MFGKEKRGGCSFALHAPQVVLQSNPRNSSGRLGAVTPPPALTTTNNGSYVMADTEFAGDGAEMQVRCSECGWNGRASDCGDEGECGNGCPSTSVSEVSAPRDVIGDRLRAKADEIRRTHDRCAKLTAPCKVDCLCWFEAADAEADRTMHMSDEEIRAEIIAGGEDPDEVADRVRRIIASAIAQHVRPTTAKAEGRFNG